MSDRDIAIDTFLRGAPWETWDKKALPADASARRYLRLTKANTSVILMDADPKSGQDTIPFTRMANWLLDNSFSAPKILKADTALGLLVIEDLGRDDFAQWAQTHPKDMVTLYAAATDVLIGLDQSDPPANLPVMSADIGGTMLDVTSEWYATSSSQTDLIPAMTEHLARLCGPPDKLALRDFHVENLIWRPQFKGYARVGLLDFQDAFLAPRGYDLVSLLRDVRRTVPDMITTKMTAEFIAKTGIDERHARAAFACLAVQRNLRILGVFARLARRDGKRRYLQWVPHVWSLIQDDLQHPALSDLKAVVQRNLPPPDQSAIKDLL